MDKNRKRLVKKKHVIVFLTSWTFIFDSLIQSIHQVGPSIFRGLSARYIPDILNGTGAAARFSIKAELGDYHSLWIRPKTLDRGNFSNEKSRIYPLLQKIWSSPDNEGNRLHVIIKMQLLELSYSNEKVEINKIGSLVLHEYETNVEAQAHHCIGMVNHLQLYLQQSLSNNCNL